MLLATLKDYLHVWQIPMMAVLLVFWLAVGPMLVRSGLRKLDLPRGRQSLGRAAQINLLANGAGFIGFAVGAFVPLAIGRRLEHRWLYYLAPVTGLIAMAALGWAVHWVMLDRPAGQTTRVAVRSLGVMLLATAVVGAAVAVPALLMRQAGIDMAGCEMNAGRIHAALHRYSLEHPGQQAPDLRALVDGKYAEPQIIRCPARDDDEIGYLYAPVPSATDRDMKAGRVAVRLADRRDNHHQSRLLLYNDGSTQRVKEGELAGILARPENKAMFKLVQEEK